jgi:NMD protein affecting ribosome stability and mRNA decay
MIKDHRKDPYRSRGKLQDPTGCPECGACFRDGRWTWREAPADAPRAVCPACRRIQDGYPGGYLNIEGDFARDHGEEILGLVRNVEERARGEHPLQRLMEVREEPSGMVVTTTDGHLAHAIAVALHHAYQGELESAWADGEMLLRATWRR